MVKLWDPFLFSPVETGEGTTILAPTMATQTAYTQLLLTASEKMEAYPASANLALP